MSNHIERSHRKCQGAKERVNSAASQRLIERSLLSPAEAVKQHDEPNKVIPILFKDAQNVGWVEQRETQRAKDFVGFRWTQPNLLFRQVHMKLVLETKK